MASRSKKPHEIFFPKIAPTNGDPVKKSGAQMKIITAFVILLLSVTFVGATTVERTDLVAREAGVFTSNIRAVLNTKTNKSLVIWIKKRGESQSIWGRLLQADGSPSGAAFPIVSGSNTILPDIAFSPDANQFVLLYTSEIGTTNRFQVFVQRLNSAGRRLGPAVRMSLASDTTKSVLNVAQRIVYDQVSKGYLALLTRSAITAGTPGIQECLYGAVFNPDLTVRKPLVLMSPLVRDGVSVLGPTVSDLKFHPPSGKVLVAGYTTVTNGGGFQYFLGKADPTLQNPKVTLTKLKNGASSGAAPDVNLMFLPDGNAVALFVEGTGLRKRKINQLGAPIGSVSFFYSGTLQNIPVEFPVSAVAQNENRSEVAVVSIEDSTMMTGRIWLQTANATGALTSTGFSLQTDLDTNGRPAIVALPIKLPSGFLYAVVHMEGGQFFPPSPTDSSGLVLLKVNTSP